MSRFAGRTLDRIWFIFFVFHIPVSLVLDLQPLYPPTLLARTPLPKLMQWYTTFSRDPFILGTLSTLPQWDWARVFIALEGYFQLPIWVIGAYCLWHNDKRVYPLLLAYGASTATTLLPVLQVLFTDRSIPPLSKFELGNLLASYIPFLLIPLGIAVDMGIRLTKIIGHAQERKAI